MKVEERYNQLIQFICDIDSLVDIASYGKATQSSYSKWSHEKDAQRAVDGNDYSDFSFHTDKQSNPWWEIEFTSEESVHTIVINNRKQAPFDERASNLKVVVYNKQGLETILHQGKAFFGSMPNSMPLILTLNNKIPVKRLRITLEGCEPLHLSSVHILSKDISKKFGNHKLCLAGRSDGFGERLRAMLNAMVLAKKIDAKFVFKWPNNFSKSQHHAIDSAQLVFSNEFIADHMIHDIDLQGFNKAWSTNFLNSNNCTYINLNQKLLTDQIKDKRIVFDNIENEYRLAFERISFSETATIAVNAAVTSVKLREKAVAIHLRSGDIVYDKYRFMDRYHVKVIPFYILDALIKAYQRKGFDIVLFSQDTDAGKFFRDKYNVLLSSDLVDSSYDNIQKALFDIILMSRCCEIVCGVSGFAILASWIGMAKQVSYKDVLSSMEIHRSFVDSRSEEGLFTSLAASPLLKSFSIVHYLQNMQDSVATEDRINLLQEALTFDPDNDFYRFLLALTLYQNNRGDEAEKLLLQTLKNKGVGSLNWLMRAKFPSKTIFSSDYKQDYISKLNQYAKAGNLVAAYISLEVSKNDDSIEFYKFFYEDILKKSEEDILGYSLLKNALVG